MAHTAFAEDPVRFREGHSSSNDLIHFGLIPLLVQFEVTFIISINLFPKTKDLDWRLQAHPALISNAWFRLNAICDD